MEIAIALLIVFVVYKVFANPSIDSEFNKAITLGRRGQFLASNSYDKFLSYAQQRDPSVRSFTSDSGGRDFFFTISRNGQSYNFTISADRGRNNKAILTFYTR